MSSTRYKKNNNIDNKAYANKVFGYLYKYLGRGLITIPTVPYKKIPKVRYKHIYDEGLDPEKILKMFNKYCSNRDCGIALVIPELGVQEHQLVLIDIDCDNPELLNECKEKIWNIITGIIDKNEKLRNAWINETHRGYHILFKVDMKEDPNIRNKILEVSGKIKIEFYYRRRIVTVPPSKHPEDPRYYRWVRWDTPLPVLELEEVIELLKQLITRICREFGINQIIDITAEITNTRQAKNTGSTVSKASPKTTSSTPSTAHQTQHQTALPSRKLSDTQIKQIIDLLTPYWESGHRDSLTWPLIGFLIKHDIDEESTRKIIEGICDKAGDEEKNSRVYEVERHYSLIYNGIKRKEELSGKKTLIENLCNAILAREPQLGVAGAKKKASEIVDKLTRIISNKIIPNKIIPVKAKYDEQGRIVINDPNKGIILIEYRTFSRYRSTSKHTQQVSESPQAKPTRSYRRRCLLSKWFIAGEPTVYVVEGHTESYKVEFVNVDTHERTTLYGTVDRIYKKLSRLHGIYKTSKLKTAISVLLNEYIARNMVKKNYTTWITGIVPSSKGEVEIVIEGIYSRLKTPNSINDLSKARKALELLVLIRQHYDMDKFDIAMNWAAAALLAYSLSRANVRPLHLLLYGEKQTGKTTLANLITQLLFPVEVNQELIVELVYSSIYRKLLTSDPSLLTAVATTVPVVIDEAGNILNNERFKTTLKRDSYNTLLVAPLVLTTNKKTIPPELVDRFIIFEFTCNDLVAKKPQNEIQEFRKLVNEYRQVAPVLGRLLLEVVKKYYDQLISQAGSIRSKEDFLELGKTVWEYVRQELAVDEGAPDIPWIRDLSYTEPSENIEYEYLFHVLRDAINKAIQSYRRIYGYKPTLAELAGEGLLPSWLHIKDDNLLVLSGILPELEKRFNYRPIRGLRGLAERLGYTYKVVKLSSQGNKTARAMIIPLEEAEKVIELEAQGAEETSVPATKENTESATA